MPQYYRHYNSLSYKPRFYNLIFWLKVILMTLAITAALIWAGVGDKQVFFNN